MKTTISIMLVAMYFLPIQAEAKVPYNSQFCDLIFSASFEMQVDGEFPECKNRFSWNVNRIKSSFNNR